MTVLVLGHKSPDTDATASPLIWAWYLSHIKNIPAEAVLLGNPSSEAAFVFKHWGIETPKIITDLEAGQKVVIVDTNNPAELPKSIHDADICGIIDHHMLVGGLKTRGPIDIIIRPLASTATIMHDLIGRDLEKAPKEIKGLMLCCIISDTLEFRSPTTTEHDKMVAEKLAKELGQPISDLSKKMFEAKSNISAFSDKELLRMDSKEYQVKDKKLRISVLETTAPDLALSRKDGLVQSMEEVAQEDNVDQVLFFIVDILNNKSILLMPNDLSKQIAKASFGFTPIGDSAELHGVVSRKKQIIPDLSI